MITRVAIFKVWVNVVTVGSEPSGLIQLIKASHHSLPQINCIDKRSADLHPTLTFLTYFNTNITSITPINFLQICFEGNKCFDLKITLAGKEK